MSGRLGRTEFLLQSWVINSNSKYQRNNTFFEMSVWQSDRRARTSCLCRVDFNTLFLGNCDQYTVYRISHGFLRKNKLEPRFFKIIQNFEIKNSRNPECKSFPTWQGGTNEPRKHFWTLLRPRIARERDSGFRIYSWDQICCKLEHTTSVFRTEWKCTGL